MEAKIIIPTAKGERLSYELRMHHGGAGEELKIVFNTSEEIFERWLFYLLRDVGAHVVADDPARLRRILGLAENEQGVAAVEQDGNIETTRHALKT